MSEERRVSRRKYVAYAGAGVVIVAAAAAGGYYAARRPAPPTPAPTTPVQTVTQIKTVTSPIAPTGKLRVTVWDQFGYTGQSALGEAADYLTSTFEQENPNIEIKRTFYDAGAIREMAGYAYAAGTAADIVYTWPAAAVITEYAKAGYLYDMTADAKEYGWYSRLPGWAIDRCSYKGRLYAYPHEWDLYGFYYNKDLFKKMGLEVPKTWDEFIEFCEKSSKAGKVPIAFCNAPLWSGGHLMGEMMLNVGGVEKIKELLFGNGKWTDSWVVEAAETMVELTEYFPKGFEGMDWLVQASMLQNEQAMTALQGTWMLEPYVKMDGKPFEIGYFHFPPKTGGPPRTFCGEGSQFEVHAKSPLEIQKAAVKYIDFLMQPKWAGLWAERGYTIPILPDIEKIPWDEMKAHYKVPRLVEECYRATERWLIYPCEMCTTEPTSVFEVLSKEVARMLIKEVTVEETLAKIEDAWEKAKANGLLWQPK